MTAGLTLERPVEMPDVVPTPEPEIARPRVHLVRRLVGAVLTAVGIFLAVLILFLYVFTPLTAARDQHRLLAQLTSTTASAKTFALTKGVLPAEGSPVGILRIPAIHLSQAVVAGTSAADLQAGPGLMPGTPLPGAAGNSVMAGRRVTFGGPFGALAQLRSGDSIRVTDGLGTFLYTVRSVRTVSSGRPDVIGPAPDNRLTLVTSNSRFVTTGRTVVVAALRGDPVTSPTSASNVVATGELGLSGDPGAGGDILLWVDLLLIVAVATGFALWRWRRPLPTYLLAVPVLVACGLFAAQAIAMSLPATL
jgi:LPXTG-site transpeptidase (sortase) family protein